MGPYHPPLLTLALGLMAMCLLVSVAFLMRGFGRPPQEREGRVAPVWLAGIVALLMGAAWFEVIGMMFVPHPIRPVWIVMAAAMGWAFLAFALFVRWSRLRKWSDFHRWSTSFGATLACMGMPHLSAADWPRVDLFGKMVLDVLALAGFLLLARKVLVRDGNYEMGNKA